MPKNLINIIRFEKRIGHINHLNYWNNLNNLNNLTAKQFFIDIKDFDYIHWSII